jgi:hypothetical protein
MALVLVPRLYGASLRTPYNRPCYIVVIVIVIVVPLTVILPGRGPSFSHCTSIQWPTVPGIHCMRRKFRSLAHRNSVFRNNKRDADQSSQIHRAPSAELHRDCESTERAWPMAISARPVFISGAAAECIPQRAKGRIRTCWVYNKKHHLRPSGCLYIFRLGFEVDRSRHGRHLLQRDT